MKSKNARQSIIVLLLLPLCMLLSVTQAASLPPDTECTKVIEHFEPTLEKYSKLDSDVTWYLICLWEVQNDLLTSTNETIDQAREIHVSNTSSVELFSDQIRYLTEKNRALLKRVEELERKLEQESAR